MTTAPHFLMLQPDESVCTLVVKTPATLTADYLGMKKERGSSLSR